MMKLKKYLLIILVSVLSLSMMACPETINLPPELVRLVDGEVESLTSITYRHTYREDFDPDVMIQSLIDSGELMAIDYKQGGLIIGVNRDYDDISDQIIIPTFYARWLDGEDANFDGVVNADDEEFYGSYKTDQEGNYVYDQDIIDLMSFLPVGQEIDFTLKVTDEGGDSTQVSGTIIISEAE